MIDPDSFPFDKYNFETIHREIVRYRIRGIANNNGKEYLKQKLNGNHSF